MSASHLDVRAVIQQIQVWSKRTGVGLCRKAFLFPRPQVHSSGVDSAPGPQEGTVAEDAVNGLCKQRLQGREKVSGGSEKLLHMGSLLFSLCF